MLYLKKAWSLLRAVSSFVRWGDVPLVEHDRRQKICLGCNRLDVTETGVFCLECRCPHWPGSDLRTKWRMRDLRCPLGKWKRRKMVRAKFRVNNIRTYTDDPNGLKTIVLHAVYDDGIPENQRFAQATPSGTIEITINNPPASDVFKHGQEFYVDFTPVEKPAE
jgi:hypothetical protein